VVIDMQRGGPSTGLPTKPEQGDLMQAIYGRNGEAPLPVIAPASPGDCFEAAYEACRIATKYMTPVMLLADGYLGSGSEAWRIPNPDTLPPFEVDFAAEPTDRMMVGTNGDRKFLPYVRNEDTLARPWAKPGTPELEHRIGGLEKEDETGDVSYDPENHQKMVQLRAEKIQRVQQEIPPTEIMGDPDGKLLVVGWGSTRGAIEEAIERATDGGKPVAGIHLRHLFPFPPDLGEILDRYETILVPELNNGQLIRLLRDAFLQPCVPLNKIKGQPFTAKEIERKIDEILTGKGERNEKIAS
jgi:2-oxoglutarate ferredoxin oxidoreductase subunit alpha